MKHKIPNFQKPVGTIIHQNSQFYHPSEPFSYYHFNVRHPAHIFVLLHFQSHDVVAHEVYGEDAIRVTPPPPPLQSSNTSCLMNPNNPNATTSTSLPPSQTSTLMHGRSSSAALQVILPSILSFKYVSKGGVKGHQRRQFFCEF